MNSLEFHRSYGKNIWSYSSADEGTFLTKYDSTKHFLVKAVDQHTGWLHYIRKSMDLEESERFKMRLIPLALRLAT